MVDLTSVIEAFKYTLSPTVIWIIPTAMLLGVIAGAIPGFSATKVLIIVLPLTYKMDPGFALILMGSVYCGSHIGGGVPAILLNVPGTGAAVATTFDGYQMTKKGQAQEALVLSAGGSSIGGIIALSVVLFAAPSLAFLALSFGTVEMFIVILFGLALIAQISAKNIAKGFATGLFGLLLGAIGFDTMWNYPRATFGFIQLYDGLPVIPVLVGLFAVSEAFFMIKGEGLSGKTFATFKRTRQGFFNGVRMLLRGWVTILRSTFIGFVIGCIPGAGATIGSFVSYQQAKIFSKDSELFGTGVPDGVIAAETADNGVTGGALIPMLTLGIPGSETTLIMLTVMQIHGINAGPTLFIDNPLLANTVIVGMLITYLFMLVFGLPTTYHLSKLTKIPIPFLVPMMVVCTLLGAFVERQYFFDLLIAVLFGFIGYNMRRNGYLPHNLVLGVILGPKAEQYFLRALRLGDGSFSIFFNSTLSIFLWIALLLVIFSPNIIKKYRSK